MNNSNASNQKKKHKDQRDQREGMRFQFLQLAAEKKWCFDTILQEQRRREFSLINLMSTSWLLYIRSHNQYKDDIYTPANKQLYQMAQQTNQLVSILVKLTNE